MSFSSPIDIANVACQLCEVRQISQTLGFTEDSVQSNEIGFRYDKLRRAELRRKVWRFAVRKAAIRPLTMTTMFIAPVLWSSTTEYTLGSIVSDDTGYLWQSTQMDNLNNAPGNSSAWEAFFGPLSVDAYDTTGTTGYFRGEFVYETPGDGTFKVYMSLTDNNSVDPSTATSWDATVTYMKDQVVKVSSTYYVSLIDFNLNQNPATSPAPWASGTTYSAAQTVGGSDGNIYSSIGNGNVGHDPTTTTGFWTNTNVLTPWLASNEFGQAGVTWLYIPIDLTSANQLSPLASGQSTPQQAFMRNVYRLPANYLRIAPQDPKAGSVSFLGAPSGLRYKDWLFEGNYLITRETFPIVLRFVADITQVPSMDDMFCEALGASIAKAVVGRLNSNTEVKKACYAAYGLVMGDARTVDGIEQGPIQQEEDDYITARW